MKKFLLSIAAMAMCGITAFAATTTLEVKDATDIKGTDIPEKPADGSSNGQARHFQPLESLTISGYAFTFSNNGGRTEPAYYFPMSTNEKGATTIRLYVNNSMTITAPAGTEFASIIGYEGTTAYTIYNGEKTNTCTYSPTGTNKIDKLVVSTEAGENPPVPGESTFVKVTTLETGSYVFVCDGKLATPEVSGKAYGRMPLVDATFDGDKVKTSDANAFEITVAEGKATIKDAEGRFYSMDASHLTSFQFYKEENQYNYWTYAFEGDNVKFTNAVNTDCIICQSKGTQGTFYTNVAPAKNPTEFNLPQLYKKEGGSGVENIAVENDAEAVYYNLQGVQVENPVKGLYIVVKGNKSSKVIF